MNDTPKKRGPGRPPGPTGKAREGVVRFRAHKDEIDRWKARADEAGEPLSKWIRGRLDAS